MVGLRFRAGPLLPLESPDIDDAAAVAVAVAGPAKAALVPRRGSGVVACVDGPAARQEGVGHGAAAVLLKRADPRVERVGACADLVAARAVDEPGAAAGTRSCRRDRRLPSAATT